MGRAQRLSRGFWCIPLEMHSSKSRKCPCARLTKTSSLSPVSFPFSSSLAPSGGGLVGGARRRRLASSDALVDGVGYHPVRPLVSLSPSLPFPLIPMPLRGGDLGLGVGARRRRPVVSLLLLRADAVPACSCADAAPSCGCCFLKPVSGLMKVVDSVETTQGKVTNSYIGRPILDIHLRTLPLSLL